MLRLEADACGSNEPLLDGVKIRRIHPQPQSVKSRRFDVFAKLLWTNVIFSTFLFLNYFIVMLTFFWVARWSNR